MEDLRIVPIKLNAKKRYRKLHIGGQVVSMERKGKGSVADPKVNYSEDHIKAYSSVHAH